MVVATSASSDRRKAISKIKIARSFEDKIFGHDSQKVMGLMIFAPLKSPNRSYNTWRYASALIPNPNWEIEDANLQKLAGIQL
jgi:hypothetical protein